MDSPRFNIAEYKQFVKCGLSYRISTDKIKEAKEDDAFEVCIPRFCADIRVICYCGRGEKMRQGT